MKKEAKGKPKPKPQIHRSPGYPAVSLKKALDLARELLGRESSNAAPAPRIMAHWGFQPKSSGGKLYLSALLKYGLLTQEGTGSHRLFHLSGEAASVLLNPNADPDRRQTELEKAALRPAIHAELWKLWGGMLPDDKAIRRYLVRQRNFNSSAVPGVVAVLKESLEFAGLADERRTYASNRPEAQPRAEASIAPAGPGAALANIHLEMRRDIFSLEEGEVVLQWPERMTEVSFKDFEGWLQFIIQKASRSVIREVQQGGG